MSHPQPPWQPPPYGQQPWPPPQPAYFQQLPGYQQPPQPQPSSTGRVIWIIWCLAWVAFWLIFGWFLLGLNIILAVASGLMILVPVGKPRRIRAAARPDREYRQAIAPSSAYDPRFSEQERARHFGH